MAHCRLNSVTKASIIVHPRWNQRFNDNVAKHGCCAGWRSIHSADRPDARGGAFVAKREHGCNVKGYQISGNTIFNWSAAPPLGCGVYEDERSFKNSIIGNSVNFFADAAVRSAGQQSITRDNLAHAERPYNDMQTVIDAAQDAELRAGTDRTFHCQPNPARRIITILYEV